jgi:hypothetical protein
MTKFPAKSTYTFALLAIFVLLIVVDLIWAYSVVVRQRATHWAVDTPFALNYFFLVALFGIGGFMQTGLAFTELVHRSSTWWRAASAVALVAALANLADSYIYYGERGWWILYRDFVSVTISAILITFVVAWLSRRLSEKGTGTLKLVVISGGTTILLTHLFLFVSFGVHCTSGDCL